MSELGWEKIRGKVVISDLKTKILEAIELFEVKREKKSNSYGVRISLKMESQEEPEDKSQYRIAEDLGKKYASVVRALKELETYGVVISESRGRKVTYAWTYLGILLFPDLASVSAIQDFYSTVFGDYDDFVEFVREILNANKRESEQLIYYLGYLCEEFLAWVRDQIILPLFRVDYEESELPKLEKNEEFWRKLSMSFLLSHLVVYPNLEKPNELFEDAKNSKAFERVIRKLFRFGSKWFKESEMNWVGRQKASEGSN